MKSTLVNALKRIITQRILMALSEDEVPLNSNSENNLAIISFNGISATIRLLNMHRIPATLRSYKISTIYVMQDKIQNDMIYGDKTSKAILSSLSYQLFGKVNNPHTAKYY